MRTAEKERSSSVHGLASVIDLSVAGPTLPPGHPFTNVLPVTYGSAPTVADNPAGAWTVNLVSGDVNDLNHEAVTNRTLCIRGGMNAGQY
jgi:hypothetical protein